MRIAFSTSVIQRGQTGIAQYFLALTRALLPHAGDHEFTLYVLEDDLPLFDFAEGAMRLVTVAERWRPPVRNIAWHQFILPRLLRAQRADLFHVPSYRRMLWPRPCALVATICDLAPFRVPRKYDPARMFFGRVVARRLAHRQQEIIAISHNTARDIHECFGIPTHRITVVHLGLDHTRFAPAAPERALAWVAERYGLRAPFFLYVARLEHPGKNHLRLIEAYDRLQAAAPTDWELVLGGADWQGSSLIRAAAAASPHRARIRFLGFVPDADLPALYQAAGALVYPSLYEGFGLPPIEAMACGCPVISSARGSLGEVVGHAAALVDPEDAGSIQHQLDAFCRNPELRESFRRAGLSRAREFDWEKTARATLGVYARAHQLWVAEN